MDELHRGAFLPRRSSGKTYAHHDIVERRMHSSSVPSRGRLRFLRITSNND